MLRILSVLVLFIATANAIAGDSPQFRGIDGQGHSDETNLPVTWSETENIRWKSNLPGLGWSTPSIVGNQIWLTTAIDEGKSLHVIRIDRDSGAITHDQEIFHHDEPGPIHKKNSYASPSVLIEGDRAFVHFGRLGTACLDLELNVIWKTELKYEHRHGPAGSPVLFADLLIISCDGTDVQFITALDKRTGKEVWKTTRDGKMAYSTPLIINVDGKPQVVSSGGEWANSYDPLTGREIWRFHYPAGFSNVPRPVYGHGRVFVSSGYNKPIFYAIRPNGEGDITESHLAWKLDRGAPLNPSPLIIGDEIYLVADNGVVTCLDVVSGEQHWQKRLGGNFTPSPLYADGRIYILDEDGKCYVIAPSKADYEELAVNELPGRTLASIASADQSLFLRTDTALYRIQKSR